MTNGDGFDGFDDASVYGPPHRHLTTIWRVMLLPQLQVSRSGSSMLLLLLLLHAAGRRHDADLLDVALDVVHSVGCEANRAQMKALEDHHVLSQCSRFVAEEIVDAAELFRKSRAAHDRLRDLTVAVDETAFLGSGVV